MSFADELQKLADLHASGVLTAEEFQQAKIKLLNSGPGEPAPQHINQQLEKTQFHNELERIDREWALKREEFYIHGKHGRRHIPTQGGSIAGAAFMAVFGVIWTVIAVTITGGANAMIHSQHFPGAGSSPIAGPFSIIAVAFPLFGVGFILFAIWLGFQGAKKAADYQIALDDYESRRRILRQHGELPEQDEEAGDEAGKSHRKHDYE